MMTGLIYPAILGTILFSALQLAEANLRAIFSSGEYLASSVLTLKCLLFLVTLVFYGCDYLYATYTRDFIPLFFLFDFFFVACLYVTVELIDIKDDKRLAKGWLVAALYLFFMILYRLWDGYERGKCAARLGQCVSGELIFYDKVLRWEHWSIAGLLLCTILLFFWQNSLTIVVFLVVLSLVTFFFSRYAWEKKSFYFDPDAAPSSPSGGHGEFTSQATDQEVLTPNPSLNRTDTAPSRGPAG